jgi:PQQ-like domain
MTTPDDVIPALFPSSSDQAQQQTVRRESSYVIARHALARRLTTIGKRIVAAMPVLLALAALWAGWLLYSEWRIGQIELTTDGDPLVVQVLAETSDTAIGEPFDMISRAVVALPAGEYRLRVDGKGRLGRTYRIAVNHGEMQAQTISLDEGRLLGGEPSTEPFEPKVAAPIRFAPVTKALELTPGRADLVEWSGGSLIRRDGATGMVRWDAFRPKIPFARGRDTARWLPDEFPGERPYSLLDRVVDVDGDGRNDLLWFLQRNASFLAVSGSDGSMLWNRSVQLDRSSGPQGKAQSDIAGEPAISDVDRDGTPDVVATVLLPAPDEEKPRGADEAVNARTGSELTFFRRVLVAISGRSGRQLWINAADRAVAVAPGEQWRQLATLVQGKRLQQLWVVDETKWISLDPTNGRAQGAAIELDFVPDRPIQHADLDHDGEPEILATGPSDSGTGRTLHAFSIKTGGELWAADVDRAASDDPPWMKRPWNASSSPDCLLLADLDGDGEVEIVVPESGAMPPLPGYRGVRLLAGANGSIRWHRPLHRKTTSKTRAEDGLVHVAVAPDIDGDGTRDLIVVSRYDGRNPSATASVQPSEPERVFVDALSGKDGRRLWFWHNDLEPDRTTRIGAPKWWGRGPDGWPLLVVPLGEDHQRTERFRRSEEPARPIVHILEASTGRERHSVLGLARASLADLDGDGLDDLWGEVNGELRAFRGEAPETWRTLGRFNRAGAFDRSVDVIGSRSVDFDGDGIADTLVADIQAPGPRKHQTTGSHTAVARSGGDGHVIWKTEIDPRTNWFDPNNAGSYQLSSFPLPAGDLDGDGTSDVIVSKRPQIVLNGGDRMGAIELLSGRSGARIWSANPLRPFEDQNVDWIEPCIVLANGTPDLVVQGTTGLSSRARLARVSGRDGRVLWNIPNSVEGVFDMFSGNRPHLFADLDRDGALDALVIIPHETTAQNNGYELLAVSLRDGQQLWKQPLRFERDINSIGDLRVGDVDGDELPEVVAVELLGDIGKQELSVRVFGGRDGKPRWTWAPGVVQNMGENWTSIALADFDGNGTKHICISYFLPGFLAGKRVVVLDEKGNVRVSRNLSFSASHDLKAADLNGDGRDELLVFDGDARDGRICACDRELKEIWSWPPRAKTVAARALDPFELELRRMRTRTTERVLPAASGRPGVVILAPGLAIDTVTARPRWKGQEPLVSWGDQFSGKLLDAGNANRPARLIGDGLGATVCRVAIPTEADGSVAAPKGNVWVPRASPPDPRWSRPLPWENRLQRFFGPAAFVIAAALSLINVILPVWALKLVTRGRWAFRMRALMLLPILSAVPVMSFMALAPWLPTGTGPLLASEGRVFLAGTVAGVPIVMCLAWLITKSVRLQSRPILTLAGLTLITSLVVAGLWLWFDRRSMAPIEQYGWDGWYLVVLPGAYAAAVLCVLGRLIARAYRAVRRFHRRI